jgi:hypothetical protein
MDEMHPSARRPVQAARLNCVEEAPQVREHDDGLLDELRAAANPLPVEAAPHGVAEVKR